MSPSGLGFGSDPSWRCQEEPGHFAALLAREETPTELLPEPDPPGELGRNLQAVLSLLTLKWKYLFQAVLQPLLPAWPPGGLVLGCGISWDGSRAGTAALG